MEEERKYALEMAKEAHEKEKARSEDEKEVTLLKSIISQCGGMG